MTTPLASNWLEIGDLTGPPGPAGDPGTPGADGTSITGASVNGSGDLIVTLSTGGTVNAGHVVGANGSSVNFESSVADVAALPDAPDLLSAYYVRADGHLYVYEGAEGVGDGKAGYTDVGAIKGDPGDTGPAGANGVSVTGAAIDGSGHLILTLSAGGPIDAGVARGPAGANGTDGTDGADGEPGTTVLAYPAGSVPEATAYRVGTVAIGGDGKLLRAV